jgi:hypothetical protein
MSVQSIKSRVGGAHLGAMSDKELIKLFIALRDDLATLATHVNNIGAAVNNIKTNCSNATVNINIGSFTAANLNTQL